MFVIRVKICHLNRISIHSTLLMIVLEITTLFGTDFTIINGTLFHFLFLFSAVLSPLPPLPIIHHLLQFRISDPRVLQRIGGILMAELALASGDIAGLVHDVSPHGMTGGMGGLVLHIRPKAGLVPDSVDHPGSESAAAVRIAASRGKRAVESGKVSISVSPALPGGSRRWPWRLSD
jgi:hypothetical protein